MPEQPIRLALVMDHPAQQFARGLRLLASSEGLETNVYYWSIDARVSDPGFGRTITWDVDLLGGYSYQAPPTQASVAKRVWWIIRCIHAQNVEVLVCYGWASLISRLSIAYCVATRTPLLLYGDTTWQHSGSGRSRLIRSLLLRLLFTHCRGAVSTGTFNREFYIRHGMPPERIAHGVCPAETHSFRLARLLRSECATSELRPLRIGFAGKLIESKGVDELIYAVSMLPRGRSWELTIVGEGPMMRSLQELAQELGVADKVDFHGFANTSAMPDLLAGFDVLVAPSRQDMRVLVTIEAMAAGAAVIVSSATAVWGPGDLVGNGATGLVYRSGSPSDLCRQLTLLLDKPELLAALQRAGSRRIVDFGPEAFSNTMLEAARAVAKSEV